MFRFSKLVVCSVLAPGLLLLAASGCQASAPSGITPTEEHKALFAGTYTASVTGGAEVYMHVADDLAFEFKQPLAEYKVKTVKGTLSVTGDRTAKAGQVKLEWFGTGTVRVKSPFGSSMTAGGGAGTAQSQWGAEYTLRRQ